MSMCVAPPVRLRGVGAQPALALYTPQRWPPEHRTVTVRFLDGAASLRERVRTLVGGAWNRASGLQFAFVERAPSDVRITFAGAGNWCYPGTYCLNVPEPEPTMCLSSVTESVPARGVILHEFGHAAGYCHEQQSPNAAIPWDLPAVYAHYAAHGWDKAMVDAQVLWRLGEDVCEAGAYDAESVMHYFIPPALVLDRLARGGNDVLSGGDVAMARHWYGDPPALPEPASPPGVAQHRWFLPVIRAGGK